MAKKKGPDARRPDPSKSKGKEVRTGTTRGPYNKFPLKFEGKPAPSREFHLKTIIPLEEVKREYVRWVLHRLSGDKDAAARCLGISVRTMYNLFPAEPEAPEPATRPGRRP